MYIGATANLNSRINTHFRELKLRQKRALIRDENGKHLGVRADGSNWQADYDKFGVGAFEVYVLEENVKKEDREDREDFWIAKYKSADPKYGYNLRKERIPKVKAVNGLPPLPKDYGVLS